MINSKQKEFQRQTCKQFLKDLFKLKLSNTLMFSVTHHTTNLVCVKGTVDVFKRPGIGRNLGRDESLFDVKL